MLPEPRLRRHVVRSIAKLNSGMVAFCPRFEGIQETSFEFEAIILIEWDESSNEYRCLWLDAH
jgi:hypothetical protein